MSSTRWNVRMDEATEPRRTPGSTGACGCWWHRPRPLQSRCRRRGRSAAVRASRATRAGRPNRGSVRERAATRRSPAGRPTVRPTPIPCYVNATAVQRRFDRRFNCQSYQCRTCRHSRAPLAESRIADRHRGCRCERTERTGFAPFGSAAAIGALRGGVATACGRSVQIE